MFDRARWTGLFALVLWMGAMPAPRAAAQSEGFTPERMAALRSVSSAEISPDGRFVAYTVSVPRTPWVEDDGTNRSQLYVADVTTRESWPFVTSPEGVRSVHWTRDGTGICFLAKRGEDEHTSLYVIPLYGGEAQRLVGLEDRSIASYRFSEDGARLAMLAAVPEPKERKAEKDKGFKQEIYEEDWRPTEIWLSRPYDERDAPTRMPLDGHVYDAVWSPDGETLAVSIAPTALVDDQYMQQRVWLVDGDTGSVRTMIDNPGKLGPVVWSPDGTELALVAAQDLHDGIAGRLLLASASTGKLRNRLLGYAGDVHQAIWREDGIYLATSQGVHTAVEKVGEGDLETQIEPGGPVFRGLSLAGDQQTAAFVASTSRHPDEVYVASLGGKLSRLTNVNPWLDDLPLGEQEVLTYTARDGELDVEALLIKPVDFQEGQRYPLVVIVHGGPESHFSNGWNTSYGRHGQMLAARGYLVLYPNYRGSTGRGIDFIKASLGDPAGKEFDDVVDGVDFLIEQGLADPDKVGVTGGSYGGYATGWMSTYYSHRFAAGVMFVGISDKISKVGTTDIPNEEFCVHALKRPWEDWNFFLERSPIFYADRQKTPLLILHGKDDPRVDPGQSRELYRHCKLRGQAPVRLVLYPGEGHGNRKAAAKYDYSLRTLRWFDHYLKGPGGEAPDPDLDYSAIDPKSAVENAGN